MPRINNPDVTSETTIHRVVKGSEVKRVLVVKTNLTSDINDAGYDADRWKQLLADVDAAIGNDMFDEAEVQGR